MVGKGKGANSSVARSRVGRSSRRRLDRIVGRYRVLSELGRGTMGRVFAAYDPELERKIAVKLLDDARCSESGKLRMVREAQVLARLSHPNVVEIHDVGQTRAGVFIAMELIEGETLGHWIRHEADRPWRRVLELFIQAAQGLAAAHELGVVHRDFKPDNVMIGRDGRVRVMDFGLARGGAIDPTVTEEDGLAAAVHDSAESVDEHLTQTGALLGTPAYMAPEQFDRTHADGLSDQFSFCVSLYEALAGHRPFRGKTVTELARSVTAHDRSHIVRPPRIPRRLHRCILKGLRRNPRDRHPSMKALVSELRRLSKPSRYGRRTAALSVPVVLAAAVAFTTSSGAVDECLGADAGLDGVWDETRRSGLRESLWSNTSSERLAAEVVGRLDAYAASWDQARREACDGGSEDAFAARQRDLRLACLSRARSDLEAAVAVLTETGTDASFRAPQLVSGLRPVSMCTAATLDDIQPPSDESATDVSRIRHRLAEARAQRRAGQFERAESTIYDAQVMSMAVDYSPVQTEVSLEHGLLLSSMGRYDESEETLRHALSQATSLGQRGVMRDAALQLTFVVGYRLGRPDDAEPFLELLEEMSRDNPRYMALYSNNRGNLEFAMGHYGRAEVLYRDALMWAATDEAQATAEFIAEVQSNLGGALLQQGRYEESEAVQQLALAGREETWGRLHPDVAMSKNNLALVHVAQHREDVAESEMREALEIREVLLGLDHPLVAQSRMNLGAILLQRGHNARAEAEFREAIEKYETTLPVNHPAVALAYNDLGEALRRQGRLPEAEVALRTSLDGSKARLGDNHEDVVRTQTLLGEVMLARNEPERALEYLEPAYQTCQSHPILAGLAGQTRFALARALWESSTRASQRTRATVLARSSLTYYAKMTPRPEPTITRVQQWLDEHAAE